ncbi:hypothetical protein PIROE2DRAFT_21205 [Piromyces sp. E2]|nr:hypothetical protein PIROE2DRAFT_21205 [Piromyces sp. E2]|eukprot:OUM59619.1 hypothetical protein PIROE2DRAFT_21205 [Piromyces sp. E2]
MPSKNIHPQEQSLYPELHTLITSNDPIKNKKMMTLDQNESLQNELDDKKQLEHQLLPTLIVNNELPNTEENSIETETSTFPDFLIQMKEKVEEEVVSNDDVHPHYPSFQSYCRHSLSSFSISTTTTATTTTTITTTAIPTPTIRPFSFCSTNSGIMNKYKHSSLSSRNSLIMANNYTLTKQNIKNIISQTIICHAQSPKMLFSPLNDMCSSTSKTSSLISYPRNSISSQSQYSQHKNEEENPIKNPHHSIHTKNEENLEKRNNVFVNNCRPSSSLINEIEITFKNELNPVANDTINTLSNKISKEEFCPSEHSDNTNNTSDTSDHTIHNIHNDYSHRDSFDSMRLSSPEEEEEDGQAHQQNYSFQYTFQYYLLQIFDKLLLRNEQVKRYRIYQGEQDNKSLSNPLFLELFLQVLLDSFSKKFLCTESHYRTTIDEPWITVLFIYFNQYLLQKQLKRPTLLPQRFITDKKENHCVTPSPQNYFKGVSPINKFKQVYRGELHRHQLKNHNKSQLDIRQSSSKNTDINNNHLMRYENELWGGMKTLSRIHHYIRKRSHSRVSLGHDKKDKKRGLSRISKTNLSKPMEKKELTVSASSSSSSSPSTIPVNISSNPNSFLNYYMQYKKSKEKQTPSKDKRNSMGRGSPISHESKEKDHLSNRKVNTVVFKHKDSLKCYHSNNTKKLKAKNKENVDDDEKSSHKEEEEEKEEMEFINEEKDHQLLFDSPLQKKEESLLPKLEPISPLLSSTMPSHLLSLSKGTPSTSPSPVHHLNIRSCSVPLEAIQAMEEKYQHYKETKTNEQILSNFYHFLVKEDEDHRQRKNLSSTTAKKDNNKRRRENSSNSYGSHGSHRDSPGQSRKGRNSYSSFFSYDSDSFYEHEYELRHSSESSESTKENDSDINSELEHENTTEKETEKSIADVEQKRKLQSFTCDEDTNVVDEFDDFISLNENPKSFCGSSVSSISLTSFSGISFHEQSCDEEINEEEEEEEEEEKKENKKEKNIMIEIKDENDHDNNIDDNHNPEEKDNNMMIENNILEMSSDDQKLLNNSSHLFSLPRTSSLTRLKEYQQRHKLQYQQQQQQQQQQQEEELKLEKESLLLQQTEKPPLSINDIEKQPLLHKQQPSPQTEIEKQPLLHKQQPSLQTEIEKQSPLHKQQPSLQSQQEKEPRKREKRLSFSPPLIPLDEKDKNFYAQSRGSGSIHLPKHQPSTNHLYPLITLKRSLSTSTSRYTGRDKGMYGGGIEHKSSWTSASVFSLPTLRKSNSIRSWQKEEHKVERDSDSDYRRIPQIKKEIMSFTPPNENRPPSNKSVNKIKSSGKDTNTNNKFNNIDSFNNNNSNGSPGSPLSNSDQKLLQPSSSSSKSKGKTFKFPKMKKQASLSSLIFRHKYHHQKSSQPPLLNDAQQHHLSSPFSFSPFSPTIQPIKKSPSMSQVLSNPRKRSRDRSSLNTTINYSLLPLPGFDEEEEIHYLEDDYLANSPETTTTLFDDGDDHTTQRTNSPEEKDPNTTISSSMATIGTATSTNSTITNSIKKKLKGKKSKPYLRAIKSSLELLKIKNNGRSRTDSNKTGSSQASSSTTLANDSLMDTLSPFQSHTSVNAYHYTFGEGTLCRKEPPESNKNKKLKNGKKVKKNEKKSSTTNTNTTTNTTSFSSFSFSPKNKSKMIRIGKKNTSSSTHNHQPSHPYNLDFDFDFDAIDVATVINTNTTVQSVILEEKEPSTTKEELKTEMEYTFVKPEEKHFNETDYSLTTMLPLPPSDSEEEEEEEEEETNTNAQSNTLLQPSFFVHGGGEGVDDVGREEEQVLSALSSLTLTPIPHSSSPTPTSSFSNHSILTSSVTPMMTSFNTPILQPPCYEEEEEEEEEKEKEKEKEVNNSTLTSLMTPMMTPFNTPILQPPCNEKEEEEEKEEGKEGKENPLKPPMDNTDEIIQESSKPTNTNTTTSNPNNKMKIQINTNRNLFNNNSGNTNNNQQQYPFQEKGEIFSSPLDLSLPSPNIYLSFLNSQGQGQGYGHGLGTRHEPHHYQSMYSTTTTKPEKEDYSTSFSSPKYSFSSMQRQHPSHRDSTSSQYSIKSNFSNFSKKSIVSL